ncbi:MAG TPA: ATP-binding protein [Gammaproteobacteria bacterium]
MNNFALYGTNAIIESAPLAMIMADTSGSMVTVNKDAEQLFGYQRRELLGEPVELLFPKRFRNSLTIPQGNSRDKRMAHPAHISGREREIFGLHKNGKEFPVKVGLNPVRTHSGIFMLAGFVDISDRKSLEQHLQERTLELERQTGELTRAYEALERSNMELQQFVYAASHDLQSPLRSISGFVQLLEEDYATSLNPETRECIRRTIENVEQMKTLIRDLISYSQIDAHSIPFEPTDMNQVFEDTTRQLEASILETGAIVTRDTLPVVSGDRLQLVQLVQQLIGNAIKYHSNKTPRVHMSARKNGTAWRFRVSDNGIGIAPKYQSRIFSLFRRLHTQQDYPGTGVGLPICRRVVHRHGGAIWVESEPGNGSTFYFTIPITGK